MDARKHHSAIGYLSIWSREDWRKNVPRIWPALFSWSRVSLDGEFRLNEWKIHMAQFSEQLAGLSERTRCANGCWQYL